MGCIELLILNLSNTNRRFCSNCVIIIHINMKAQGSYVRPLQSRLNKLWDTPFVRWAGLRKPSVMGYIWFQSAAHKFSFEIKLVGCDKRKETKRRSAICLQFVLSRKLKGYHYSMATSSSVSLSPIPPFRSTARIISQLNFTRHSIQPLSNARRRRRMLVRTSYVKTPITAKQADKNALQYRKLGDSDLVISEITLGTVRT